MLEPENGHYTLSASFALDDGTTEQVDDLLAGLGLEGVRCGMACSFPSTSVVSLGVCDGDSPYLLNYCGTLNCTLVYDGNSITLTEPDYMPYSYAEDPQG